MQMQAIIEDITARTRKEPPPAAIAIIAVFDRGGFFDLEEGVEVEVEVEVDVDDVEVEEGVEDEGVESDGVTVEVKWTTSTLSVGEGVTVTTATLVAVFVESCTVVVCNSALTTTTSAGTKQ